MENIRCQSSPSSGIHKWPILLLCALLALGVASSSNETCLSLECVTLAAEIASQMNLSADPCEDFYNFACGNFQKIALFDPRSIGPAQRVDENLYIESTDLMTEKIERKIFEILVLPNMVTDRDPDIQKLYNLTQSFFISCTEYMMFDMKSLSISFLKGIFDHLIESIEPSAEKGEKTIESIMAAIVRTGGGTLINTNLPSSFINEAFLSNSDLTNISRASLNTFERRWSPDAAVWYEKFLDFLVSNQIVRSLNLDGANTTYKNIVTDFMALNESAVLDCITNSSESQYTLSELDTFSECAQQGNSFSWSRFFEELLDSPIDYSAIVTVPDVTRVILVMNYFKERPVYSNEGQVFSEYTSYLILDWLVSFGDFLPPFLRSGWTDVVKQTHFLDHVLMKPTSGRVDGCMRWTKTLLQPILERMYRSAYQSKTFKVVNDLVHLIQRASVDSVMRQTWIKGSDQEAIIEKVNSIRHSVGFEVLNRAQLKDLYNKTLDTIRAKNLSSLATADEFGYLTSIVLCASSRKVFDLISGNSPVTAFAVVSSLVVNAYNYIEKNRIIFPMATLEPPVFHTSYPDYIKLGNLGYTIGHEIGHSFDNEGHKLNSLGAKGHFWGNDTETAYLERVECVRSCYGNYSLYPGWPNLSSNTTVGNDISDIMGIQAAYNALKMLRQSKRQQMPNMPNLHPSLSQDQLFFVQAAQGWCAKAEPSSLIHYFGRIGSTHSANHLRVTGMMQNSWDFARTFGCKLGQRMHPTREKCTFW